MVNLVEGQSCGQTLLGVRMPGKGGDPLQEPLGSRSIAVGAARRLVEPLEVLQEAVGGDALDPTLVVGKRIQDAVDDGRRLRRFLDEHREFTLHYGTE